METVWCPQLRGRNVGLRHHCDDQHNPGIGTRNNMQSKDHHRQYLDIAAHDQSIALSVAGVVIAIGDADHAGCGQLRRQTPQLRMAPLRVVRRQLWQRLEARCWISDHLASDGAQHAVTVATVLCAEHLRRL